MTKEIVKLVETLEEQAGAIFIAYPRETPDKEECLARVVSVFEDVQVKPYDASPKVSALEYWIHHRTAEGRYLVAAYLMERCGLSLEDEIVRRCQFYSKRMKRLNQDIADEVYGCS